MKKANSKYFVVGSIVTIMIAVIGVTYAYWRGMIRGSGSNMSVTLDKVYIQFTDSTEIAETGVRPGWSTSKTFAVENQGSTDFKYDIYIKDLINTLATEGYFQYKITSNNNGYNMEEYAPIAKSPEASDFDLGTGIIIGSGVTQTYTISFRYVNDPDVDQSEDMGKRFGGQLMIRENTDKTLYSILSDGKKYKLGERGTFDTPFGGETIQDGYNQEKTIYKVDNDYYFAGNPQDNWVKFAGLWWRIIRTNSSEGTRLLYAGTSHDGQDGYINNTTYQWNSSNSEYTYVYWNNVSFKSVLSSWYTSNITESNDNMVNNIVYCNDTSYTDMSSVWGTNGRIFGAYDRLVSTKAPSNSCSGDNNGFGGASKVGMMTADEVAYAGGVYQKNVPNTYYYRNGKISGCTGSSGDECSVTGNNGWWTLSPYMFNSGQAHVLFVYGSSLPGYLSIDSLFGSNVVRPVITLKPDVLVTGEGTTDSPYEIVRKPKLLYTTLTNGETYTVDETRDTAATSPIEGTSITQGYNHTGKIYLAEDNYYFAGNPSDNWVLFADKWWRIIRTNSTEGTRLLYAGTTHDGQDGYINNTTYAWNNTYDNYTYVNWENASFKDTLNTWYSSNITGDYDKMVKSIVYCNDTSFIDMSSSDWGTNGRKYGAYIRLVDGKTPSYSCEINGFGNIAKVGMMTADEIAYAGGIYGNDAPNTYYYRNSKISGCTGTTGDSCSVTGDNHWWTMSPSNFKNGFANVFRVYGARYSGNLGDNVVHNLRAIRPVITLAPNIKITGSGTTTDPYVPSL